MPFFLWNNFKVYNLDKNPPQEPEVIARLIQRTDDTEETFMTRLNSFRASESAIETSLKQYGIPVIHVNGDTTLQQVYSNIEIELNSVQQRIRTC